MRVLIVGGGPVDLDQLRRELADGPDLVIAADSGGKHLNDIGRFPQVLMGDFDSLTEVLVQKMSRAGAEIISYPVAKDQTDLELAVDLALARGANLIRIIGGLGERLDHTLANIGLLLKAYQKGVVAFLIDSRQEVTLSDSDVELRSEPGRGVSLIPLTPKVSGITTSGLKFPINNGDLHFYQTRGIHNEFSAPIGKISVKEGMLLIITFQE